MTREQLIAQAERLGIPRPRVLTQPELVDEIIGRTTKGERERAKARGWLGRARDLLATVVEKGLHLPEAARALRQIRFHIKPYQLPNTGVCGLMTRTVPQQAIKDRSAQRCLERHRPRSRDIERCPPALYGRVEVGQRECCRFCGRSGPPSSASSSACRKQPARGRYSRPSGAPAGHIAELICEGLHEVDLGREIGNR